MGHRPALGSRCGLPRQDRVSVRAAQAGVPPKPSAEPLWLLALLQREGRLLDFLLEDMSGYTNEQIGAAVRDIHRQCKKAIDDHLVLEPVMPRHGELAGRGGGRLRSERDPAHRQRRRPAAVPRQLLHHGWRVREIKLSRPPEGQDQFVVQPAEVEVS